MTDGTTNYFSVTWYLNGDAIRTSDRYIVGSTRSKRTLEILNCQITDDGVYQCVAESKTGVETCDFTLSVSMRSKSRIRTSIYER